MKALPAPAVSPGIANPTHRRGYSSATAEMTGLVRQRKHSLAAAEL